MRELRTRTAPRKPRAVRVGTNIEELAAQIQQRQQPRFFGLLPEQASLIARFYPTAADLAIEEADRIARHEFDILGSGPVSMGAEIDWHTDFKTNHSWPVEHFTRLTIVNPNGGFDVKVPWELSRFHHGLRLGQAYLYTGDEAYARELIAQVTHWIDKNPHEFGVNWASPMEVAIRAVNWIWCYYAILTSESLTTKFLAKWLTSLRQHGDHLVKHLEDGWPRTNHLIANLTGLVYLGVMFPEFADAEKWRIIGLTRLWDELERQIYADGMNYEASLPYHCLVTEMVLSVAGLCLVNGIPVPDTTQAQLRAMLDVIMNATQPDGCLPLLGDADDGHLLPLSVYAEPRQRSQDKRYLLALGSIILERELPEWAGFVDPTRRRWSLIAGAEWQHAFWYFPSDTAARLTDVLLRITRRPEGTAPEEWVDVNAGLRVQARALARKGLNADDLMSSRSFEAGGIYIMRHQDFHMLVDAGSVGQNRAGGHAHNDTLSMTLHALGRTFLIDPGTYTYTADPKERNRFRSTAYHNTLQVNREEINRIPDGEVFRLNPDANVIVHSWLSQPTYDILDVSHTGYTRLKPGVVHRRQIYFDKSSRLWVLHDRVFWTKRDLAQSEQPQDLSQITLWFHFAPMKVRLDRTNNAIRTEEPTGPNLILLPMGDFPLIPEVEEGWYSPRYGVKEKAPVAKFSGRVTLPADFVVLLYPHDTKMDLKVVRTSGRKALLNLRKILTPPRAMARGAASNEPPL
ncbi:MAG: hypothetical protein GYB68_00470 [Chloroflexi bacterium]|nr:hypothetical protein [Chloroflexota bacterium]